MTRAAKDSFIKLLVVAAVAAVLLVPGASVHADGLPDAIEHTGKIDGSAISDTKPMSVLIATALETAGYNMQAIVLKDLGDLLTSMGALFFIATVWISIIAFLIMRDKVSALWHIIGPTLFMGVVFYTVKAGGVDWQYGSERVQPSSSVVSEQAEGKVSGVFHIWNRLVSSVINTGLDLILENGVDENTTLVRRLNFMTRQKIMDRIESVEITDSGLRALIHYGLKGECYAAMEAAQYVSLGKRDVRFQQTPTYRTALARYGQHLGQSKLDDHTQLFNWSKKHVIKDSAARSYLKDLLTFIRDRFNEDDSTTNITNEYLTRTQCHSSSYELWATSQDPEQRANQPLSCSEIWCYTALGLSIHASDEVGTIDSELSNRVPAEERQMLKEIWNDIASKMAELPPAILVRDENGKVIKIETGNEILDELFSDPSFLVLFNFPEDQDRIHPSPALIPVIIAGKLLRKELNKNIDQSLLTQVAEHANYSRVDADFTLNLSREQADEVVQRIEKYGISIAKRYEAFSIAMLLPYVQGLILYFLAITFPFFALLLIIPDQASGFLTWLALWAWAKSWELGFAFVIVIDEALWNLMPASSRYDPFVDPRFAPISILESAYAGDPAYNLGTYYTVITTLLLAVPMVSAQIVLGGKSIFANLLIGGIAELGETLGFSAKKWSVHDMMQRIDKAREAILAKNAIAKSGKSQAPETAELERLADAAETEAAVWQLGVGGAGIVQAAVGGVQLAAAPFTGGATAPAGAYNLETGVGVAATGIITGNAIDEQANRTRAAWVNSNTAFAYYGGGKLESVRAMDAIRGGLSGRGEYWNIPDSPVGAARMAIAAAEDHRANILSERVAGGVGLGISLMPAGGPSGMAFRASVRPAQRTFSRAAARGGAIGYGRVIASHQGGRAGFRAGAGRFARMNRWRGLMLKEGSKAFARATVRGAIRASAYHAGAFAVKYAAAPAVNWARETSISGVNKVWSSNFVQNVVYPDNAAQQAERVRRSREVD